MKARLAQLAAYLDGRSLRERLLIFAAVAGILGLLVFQGLLVPVSKELGALKQESRAVRAETAGLREEIARLEASRFQKERERLAEERAALEDRITRERKALQAKVGEFIRPARLMAFFEDILLARGAGRVRVKGVEGLAREPLSLGGKKNEVSGLRLFRKGVKVVVETDYASTLRFLERIEELPWAVQVTDLNYRVAEFPRAELTLTAHTFLLKAGGAANGG